MLSFANQLNELFLTVFRCFNELLCSDGTLHELKIIYQTDLSLEPGHYCVKQQTTTPFCFLTQIFVLARVTVNVQVKLQMFILQQLF